ncbi:MAG: TolC family protein [Rhodocyclaceae bacterium]|nr:TolC family protein [Rhodocyclaceae bacterium]
MNRKQLAGLATVLGICPVLAQAAGVTPVMPAPKGAAAMAAPGAPSARIESLSLKEFVDLISRSDEQVLVQRLEADIAEQGVKGAKAIFEPSFFVEASHDSQFVQNTSSEALQRSGQSLYRAKDNNYKTGLDFKLPWGTDAEIFYNPSRLTNSLQIFSGVTEPEYKASLGFKLTQPLLRNAGREATTTNIRVAEQDTLAARETVRQVLAQRVMDGMVVYFNLQRARERVRLRSQALDLAEKILLDLRKQEKAGLKSAGDTLDAESAASLRRSQLAQGQQDLEEQQNLFQAFISARERAKGARLAVRRYETADPLVLLAQPVETPLLPQPTQEKSGGNELVGEDGAVYIPATLRDSLARRPEIRVNDIRLEREAVRMNYAQNQKLPEVNLTVRYGIEDINQGQFRNPGDYFGSQNFPYNSWSVGVQVRYYLFGDEKRSSEYEAAHIRRRQVELAQAALQQRIVNELESSAGVLEQGRQTVRRQQEIVTSQRMLLEIESNLVKEGKKSSIDLMRKQLELLTAEESLADSIVIANRASFLVSQAHGLLLKRVGLE